MNGQLRSTCGSLRIERVRYLVGVAMSSQSSCLWLPLPLTVIQEGKFGKSPTPFVLRDNLDGAIRIARIPKLPS